MSRFLVVLAIGFFFISTVDTYEVRNFVETESAQSVRVKIEELLRAKANEPATRVDILQQGLLLMEADALDKRYRQASALLMSRIWTRQLAFMTGMVLAFIDAAFIIGKLSEGRSHVTVGAADWKAGISSASPGLVLAFLGTLLSSKAVLSLVSRWRIICLYDATNNGSDVFFIARAMILPAH